MGDDVDRGYAAALQHPRHVDRGVAAADDGDAAGLDHRAHRHPFLQQVESHVQVARHCAVYAPFAVFLRAGAEEDCAEILLQFLQRDVAPELLLRAEVDAGRQQPLDFGLEHVARQAVGRDGHAAGAAGDRQAVEQAHPVAAAQQVVGGGQASRPGADDGDLACFCRRQRDRVGPAEADRLVAEKAFHAVDADRFIVLAAVAGGFAGMVADPPGDPRQRIGFDDSFPGLLRLALRQQAEIGLRVLACRAGIAAGRRAVMMHRLLHPPGAGLEGQRGAG